MTTEKRASDEADYDQPTRDDKGSSAVTLDPVDESDAKLEAEIRALYRAIEHRDAEDYDGIVGRLPEWMPEPLRVEFESLRRELLSRFSTEQVLEWIGAFRRFKREGEIIAEEYSNVGEAARSLDGSRSIEFPLELRRELSALVYIQDIFSLGKVDAIPAYLGTGPHKVYRDAFVAEHDRERRVKGTMKSAEARKEKNVDRDRRIHDARDAKRGAKQIAGDEELSPSTVNRILKRPRP